MVIRGIRQELTTVVAAKRTNCTLSFTAGTLRLMSTVIARPNTDSRPITAVKQYWAWPLLGWVTD